MVKRDIKSAGIGSDDVLDVTVSNGAITLEKPFRHKTLETSGISCFEYI